jgi:two-component system response regulator FlrC
MRLLVVDDEAVILVFLSHILRAQGHEVVTATNPADARLVAGRHAFDIVISDVNMGGSDTGITLVLDLRLACPDLGVVLMSGSYTHQVPPFFAFLIKPFSRQTLLDTIAIVMANRKMYPSPAD